MNDKSIPSINKEALSHAFFTFERIFPDYYSDLFEISIQKIRNNKNSSSTFRKQDKIGLYVYSLYRVNQISISKKKFY